MKLRTFIADNFGGINEALAARSSIAAVIHGLDVKAGKRCARGKHDTKNPFRGIACRSPRMAQFSRHIEGARDTRKAFSVRSLSAAFAPRPFRDSNPIPCAFLP